MSRPALEVADIFRDHGAAWRRANAGHVSLDQMKVMSAIERCRTVALGGHVARCEGCAHTVIEYNSCLMGKSSNGELACRHRFKASAETMITIAADPKQLGARIGIISVLHSWGSALTHHPHVHMIAPGGGLSEDGTNWIACRPNFFLSVRVLSRLFRRLVLQMLIAAHEAGRLQFFGAYTALVDANAFAAFLAPLRRSEWVVYSKKPFGGSEAVLAYLARYTHRVAIANSRLVAADGMAVTFKYKDYRIEGPKRYKLMTSCHRRVHPPLSDARFAERLSSHSPLWVHG